MCLPFRRSHSSSSRCRQPPVAEAETSSTGRARRCHDLRSSMQKKQDRLNAKGLELKLKGKAKGKVAQIAIGQYAQLQHTGEDEIFVILAEFGNTRHSSYCDPGQVCAFPPDGSAATYEGPAHNSIPQPDRAQDNSTLWQSDFSKAHYENMYFNRMAAYYQGQSSGRYTVGGQVTELGEGAVQRGALRP